MRPGGIIRIVVPDLESLTLEYIKKLNEARNSYKDKEMDINKKVNFQFIVDLILDDLTKESHVSF